MVAVVVEHGHTGRPHPRHPIVLGDGDGDAEDTHSALVTRIHKAGQQARQNRDDPRCEACCATRG
jgi:hypothetical protein